MNLKLFILKMFYNPELEHYYDNVYTELMNSIRIPYIVVSIQRIFFHFPCITIESFHLHGSSLSRCFVESHSNLQWCSCILALSAENFPFLLIEKIQSRNPVDFCWVRSGGGGGGVECWERVWSPLPIHGAVIEGTVLRNIRLYKTQLCPAFEPSFIYDPVSSRFIRESHLKRKKLKKFFERETISRFIFKDRTFRYYSLVSY